MSTVAQAQNRDFVRVGKSRIQGQGVFAKRRIPRGTRIAEYAGERVAKHDLPADFACGLTTGRYLMNLTDDVVIDGERGGNLSRYVNHGCAPNCEFLTIDGVPYLYAMVDIPRWCELTFDYQLFSSANRRLSRKELRKLFPCHCGAPKCRGTMVVQ